MHGSGTDHLLVPASQLVQLRDLLESIRISLDSRFERLEAQFQEHVESAFARTLLLENEVKILALQLKDALPARVEKPHISTDLHDILAEAATLSKPDVSTRHSSCLADRSHFQGGAVMPRHESLTKTPLLQRSPACHAQIQLSQPELIAFHSSAEMSGGASAVRQLQDAADKEGQDLINRLTSKCSDTQRLLAQAQEKIRQAGLLDEIVSDKQVHRWSQGDHTGKQQDRCPDPSAAPPYVFAMHAC
jgi:hypothetical protein